VPLRTLPIISINVQTRNLARIVGRTQNEKKQNIHKASFLETRKEGAAKSDTIAVESTETENI
jgi:hypothetical protein